MRHSKEDSKERRVESFQGDPSNDAAPADGNSNRKLWFLLGIFAVLLAFKLLVTPRFEAGSLERADEALQDGDVDGAVKALLEHLEDHPDADDVRYGTARLLRERDPDLALNLLQQISVESPEFLAAVREIATICLMTERDEEAKHALLMLEQAQPGDFGTQLALAELLFHLEDHEQALPRALEAVELQPDRTQSYVLVAEIRDELNQMPDMIPPLERAIEIDPDYLDAHMHLAYAYSAVGRLEDARREAEWCAVRRPEDPYPHRILASVARDEGRFKEAREALDVALRIAPDDVDCRILKADLLMYERQAEEAYQTLKPLYEANQDAVRYLGALSRAAAATGRVDEARALHEKIATHYRKQGRSESVEESERP